MKNQNETITKDDIDELLDNIINDNKEIVLFNDDHNSFEHVITCLVKYCDHGLPQAEQCTMIIHNNGKCSVKKGDLGKLTPICNALLENGLSAEIQ